MSPLTADWSRDVQARGDALVALRRDFHRHPELSFEERRTAAVIAERLHAAKLEVRTGVARTGVVGILRGDRPGRTVGWRADIDALPLTEAVDVPFASATPGVMHACGHDGHAAIAVTLAEILAARRHEVAGTVVFLFQPAEEVFGGAREMLAAGVLDDPRVEEVYGLHLTTRAPAGVLSVRPGPALTSADFFDVEVTGQGGHGAYPHLSADPITAAARVLLGLQHLVAYEVAASEAAVLTVGQFAAGTKHNVLPERAVLRGSIRTFSEAVRAQLKRRLAEYATHTARAHRTEARLTFVGDGCPVTVNDAGRAAFVRRRAEAEVGADRVDDTGSPASDDMALFLTARPGCYFNVGAAPGTGGPRPHHAPQFAIDEASLAIGLRTALAVVLDAARG